MAGDEEKKTEQEKQFQEPDNTLAEVKPRSNGVEKTESEIDSPAPEEIITELEKMPPSIRRSMQAFFASFSQVSRPSYNPLFDKFTADHINKYLDNVQKDDDNAYEYKKTNRWFYLIYAVIAVVAFSAGVVFLLPRDKDLLIRLIEFLVLLAGGIGGGYGLSKRNQE